MSGQFVPSLCDFEKGSRPPPPDFLIYRCNSYPLCIEGIYTPSPGPPICGAPGRRCPGEKRRRSQWQEEQTKRLKAEALKALEPDIAQLMNRHR